MATPHFDAAIVGAGAAGLLCAALAGQRGRRVLLIDHAPKVAEKIRISGGGRCNFTNRDIDPRAPERHYVGHNPRFARSALSRYTPQDFIRLVQRHGIGFHEKHKGQLFCDEGSERIITMLLDECADGRVERWQPCAVDSVAFSGPNVQPASASSHQDHGYLLQTTRGAVTASRLVIATGGLSIPKIGASDFGYRLARQFGLPLVAQRPGLVPLTFQGEDWAPWAPLAGVALPVRVQVAGPGGSAKGRMAFDEDLLFTHRGLSGPAILQISSYWHGGEPLIIHLAPGVDLRAGLVAAKRQSRKHIANILAQWLPTRLADAWASRRADWQRPVNEAGDKALGQLAEQLARWQITPSGSEGYKKAEVTLGGVDTRALSQQSMEATGQSGLHFIGEVVDVTGWLGGYNFQWAWASAAACALAL
ncbi:NAD(P)/FAD-dependent oxidoreductase [Comamonas flocculans]|uniref:Aminoacetone oxidase family FAD-binding enzyme n=1 Tax=Comamonas flocculans TaxID=2597701 RepID=A0A5B8RXW8_9BURK|nr:aminoacetone oxidase family FAD-binding enzyme [Comamonas flocculans]QEA13963.1 aminoacetone oxidase family FAD-binding enzyme [Comamonas flocculans]